jgi:hypothetical protein
VKSLNPFCEILEVIHDFRTEKVTPTKIDHQELLKQIKETEKQQKKLSQELSRILSRRKLVQSFADTAMSSSRGGLGRSSGEGQNLKLSEAIEILEYHRNEMVELDAQEMELQEKLTELKENLSILENDLKKIRVTNSKEIFEKTRIVTILVKVKPSPETQQHLQEGQEQGQGQGYAMVMELLLSYVVSNATWSPSYDFRIDTLHNVMDLTYFAEVIQKTGEDWKDCNVCLSTSNPAIGSSPPPLPTRTIDWSYNCSHLDPLIRGGRRKSRGVGGGGSKLKGNKKLSFKSGSLHAGSSEEDDDSSDDEIASVSMIEEQLKPYEATVPTAPPLQQNSDFDVNGNDAGSTTFLIPRQVTIESDNKPHKVTVTTVSFTPQMVHYVSASLSAYVYLQAKTQNTSPYPLLSSEKVAVFLDGNFMTTSVIKQTNPNEYFNVFLGVDPSVKVQYMPCRTLQYVKGWLSGTEVKKYFYSTIIHNTKQRPIRILIAEIYPRSADEKIQIELLEPSSTSLTKASNETGPIMNEQDVIAALDGFQGGGGSGVTEPPPGGGANPPRVTQAWPRDFVTQNKFTNNIVWLKTLQPGEKTEVKFAYRVAWPQGQTIGIR